MGTLHEQFVLLFSMPLYVIVIGAEILVSHWHHTGSYTFKDTLHNFCMSLLAGGLDAIMRGVSLVILAFFYQYKLFPLSHTTVLYWIALLLFVDLMHYWLHRIGHTCRLFWAVHVNHHNSTHFNFTTGFRAGVLEPLYRFAFFIPIALAGFAPAHILLMYSLTEIWAILTHTERIKKLGWLEYFLVTPSHHRVHHASNARYLDKNMGTVFIVWDRLFGTFQQELSPSAYEPIRYGLTHTLERETLPVLVFHEWAAIWKDLRRKDIGFKEKWRYVFGPPGWSHDGSRLTSDQMRHEEALKAQQLKKNQQPLKKYVPFRPASNHPYLN